MLGDTSTKDGIEWYLSKHEFEVGFLANQELESKMKKMSMFGSIRK